LKIKKNNEERNHGRSESTKKKNLFLGILFDAVGMLSLRCLCLASFQMLFGHHAYLMTRMYKGTAGKVGGVVTFMRKLFLY
jgi:hypothetical protein